MTRDKKNDEFNALRAVHDALEPLAPDERERVLRYTLDRFEVSISGVGKSGGTGAKPALEGQHKPADTFKDFAQLIETSSPSNENDRALVAGYWLQVCQGGADFDSASANRELKQHGEPVSNIARAYRTLCSMKPMLVQQIAKSGKAKQARKTLKLTTHGINRVKQLIAGTDGE